MTTTPAQITAEEAEAVRKIARAAVDESVKFIAARVASLIEAGALTDEAQKSLLTQVRDGLAGLGLPPVVAANFTRLSLELASRRLGLGKVYSAEDLETILGIVDPDTDRSEP